MCSTYRLTNEMHYRVYRVKLEFLAEDDTIACTYLHIACMSPENTHQLMVFHMEVLILGVIL